jgi:ABC-type polysaccharide/polyol phosphate transport system ATPase subunit
MQVLLLKKKKKKTILVASHSIQIIAENCTTAVAEEAITTRRIIW